MAASLYRICRIEPGLWQLSDVMGHRAYAVVGTKAAVLVDSCIGYGDVRAALRTITHLPVTVLLTHFHYDHVGGAYFFGAGPDAAREAPRVLIAREDDGKWECERKRAQRAYGKLVRQGTLDPGTSIGPAHGTLPPIGHVQEGDEFDLGGLVVQAVALPGHTAGSMGYLVRERRVLLSGDAVTPIMCLCFDGHLGIDDYRATLAKMARLPFDVFYTGHHDVAFLRTDLDSFDDCAAFAQGSRGVAWRHSLLPEYVGTAYLPPCKTNDADSPDFRALIGPYVPRPHARRRRA